MGTIRSVLVDIDGVLCIGDAVIPGAVDALQRLRSSGAGIRFVTNTTRRTRAAIVERLRALGFDIAVAEVITGAIAARRIVESRGLRPHLLVHPGLLPEFEGLDTHEPDAVILGDAGDGFSYRAMNDAFRIFIEHPGAPLIALARNRYFREADGLSLDAGPYVAALEYAARVEAEVTGKPSAALYHAALAELGTAPGEALMIGDDLDSDIAGAQAAGLQAVLVRTGKYRPQDEVHPQIRPDAVADDFAQAVREIIVPQLRRAA